MELKNNMNSLVKLTILIFCLWACDTDFKIEAPEKEIPVIYGIFNINEPKQYIRIERAFLSNGKDIFTQAKDPKILYYQEGQAKLFLAGFGKTILGKKINGEDVGIKRSEGIFLQTPNFLYEFSTPDWKMLPPSKVIFQFETPSLSNNVSSEIALIKELTLREGVPASPLNLGYDRVVTIGWTNSIEAKLFEIVFRIHYQEKSIKTNGVFMDKYIDWSLKKSIELGTDPLKGSYSFKGVEFYKFLGSSLEISSNIQRNLKAIDIYLTGGGIEFKEILSLNEANFGLTGSNSIPRFNNIENGIGFLSSKMNAIRTDISVSASTLDSLRFGIYTQKLQFK